MILKQRPKQAVSLVEVLISTALIGLILVVVSDFGQALLNAKKFSTEKDTVREQVTTTLTQIKDDLQFATTVFAPDPDSIENGLTLERLSKKYTSVDSERFDVSGRWDSLDPSHLEILSFELDGDSLVRSGPGGDTSLLTASNFYVERSEENYFKISIEVSRRTRTETFQLRMMKL
jgi:type II secretory pathway component PulJ